MKTLKKKRKTKTKTKTKKKKKKKKKKKHLPKYTLKGARHSLKWYKSGKYVLMFKPFSTFSIIVSMHLALGFNVNLWISSAVNTNNIGKAKQIYHHDTLLENNFKIKEWHVKINTNSLTLHYQYILFTVEIFKGYLAVRYLFHTGAVSID